MFITWLNFAALYIITAAAIRLVTLKFPDSPFTRPLLFIH